MKFMECQSCKGTVQINNTGLCLGCQRGFIGVPQEDAWKPEEEYGQNTANSDTKMAELQKRQEEIEKELSNANEKPSSKSLSPRKQAKDGKRVGKGNTKRKATKKGKKEG